MLHICKMEKLEIRVVIKYFCKKGMSPMEIQESPSYSTAKKLATEFKRVRESIEDDEWSGHPKDVTADVNVKVMPTLVMCDRRHDL